MCYNLASIRLQELPERWRSLPSDCLQGSTPDFLLEFTLLAFASPRAHHTQGSADINPNGCVTRLVFCRSVCMRVTSRFQPSPLASAAPCNNARIEPSASASPVITKSLRSQPHAVPPRGDIRQLGTARTQAGLQGLGGDLSSRSAACRPIGVWICPGACALGKTKAERVRRHGSQPGTSIVNSPTISAPLHHN